MVLGIAMAAARTVTAGTDTVTSMVAVVAVASSPAASAAWL
jgi:hypothetical protein